MVKYLTSVLLLLSVLIYLSVAKEVEESNKHNSASIRALKDGLGGNIILSKSSEPRVLDKVAMKAILKTKENYDSTYIEVTESAALDEKYQSNGRMNLSNMSEKMEPVFFSHPGLVDVLFHVNLMHGNMISDEDLIDSVSDEKNEYHDDVIARAVLKYGDPDTYQALIRYEQLILGEIIKHSDIETRINSPEFQDYKNYLISDGLFVSFCSENPERLMCNKSSQIR